MTAASCITTLPGGRYCTLQMEYLVITANECAAKILKFFVYWTDRKIAHASQARQFNAADMNEGLEPSQDESLWIYASIPEIRRSLLFEYSEKTIGKALKVLTDLGFVQSRFNPKHKWDRKSQYLLRRKTVQEAIFAIRPEQIARFYEHETVPSETIEFLTVVGGRNASPETPDSMHPVKVPDGSRSPETPDSMHPVKVPDGSGSITGSTQQNYAIHADDLPDDHKDQYKDQFEDRSNDQEDSVSETDASDARSPVLTEEDEEEEAATESTVSSSTKRKTTVKAKSGARAKSSAAATKKQKKKKPVGEADQIYAKLHDREAFEKFWVWIVERYGEAPADGFGKCPSVGKKHEAAAAFHECLELPERLAEFRLACQYARSMKLFDQIGLPHVSRLIRDGHWETVLIKVRAKGLADGGESGFVSDEVSRMPWGDDEPNAAFLAFVAKSRELAIVEARSWLNGAKHKAPLYEQAVILWNAYQEHMTQQQEREKAIANAPMPVPLAAVPAVPYQELGAIDANDRETVLARLRAMYGVANLRGQAMKRARELGIDVESLKVAEAV